MQPGTARTGFGATLGRRRNARARLNIPARIVLLDGYVGCTVENLSNKGARIACDRGLKRGDQGILKRDGLDEFFTVRWVRDECCGLRFDEAVSDDAIRELRQLADYYESDGRAQIREFGRDWVEGRIGHAED